jgi:hypothetical protein
MYLKVRYLVLVMYVLRVNAFHEGREGFVLSTLCSPRNSDAVQYAGNYG